MYRLGGGWRLAAGLPLVISVPAAIVSLALLRQGSALWPLPFGLDSLAAVSLPMGALAAALWLVVLMIAWNAYIRRRAGIATASTARINFLYYALALAAILALGYATLSAWLPAPVLLLVAFAAIFWLFSFVFALVATLRRKSRAK